MAPGQAIEPPRDSVRRVAVVLGLGLLPDGSPPPLLRRRVARGVEQVHNGTCDAVLLCGGWTSGPEPEADAMARLAREAGLAADRIILERHSTTTWENALFARAIVRELKLRRLTLVTDELHMRRALWCFQTLGLAPEPSSVTWRGKRSKRARVWLHERVGLMWYRLRHRSH
ncbi:MAG: YdcF family protein [Gammaproteobacteria bacterium]